MTVDEQQREPQATWHAKSLRGRIAMLAGTVVVLLSATLLILVSVLRTTQVNAVARSQKHLAALARSLVDAYEARADKAVSLRSLALPAPPPKPLPGPPPHPPVQRPRSPQEQSLEQITASVLVDAPGIEGGFYRAADERLLGYAFPTHEGPGDPTALPARETPDIVNLATSAFIGRRPLENQFYGPHDVVLFEAMPVCETKACEGGPVGAVWLMHRIPGAEEDRKRALLWSAFGFGTIACITVLFAFLVLQRVGRGTEAVVDRLARMEVNLDNVPRSSGVRLAEFHRVLDGLDRLSVSLRTQMDRERELQTRVRHNERLAAIGQLAAGVAHELRNPLATIRLRAQMTQRKTTESATAQGASVILTEIDRLDAIIQRLLNFSRPIQINRTRADAASLCIAAIARWSVRDPQISFTYVGDAIVPTKVDVLRTDQILDNLIENAVHQHQERHTDAARIQLDWSAHGELLRLVVEDNAGGFTPEALQKATEPFFTTRAKGTGLGLAITQKSCMLSAVRCRSTTTPTAHPFASKFLPGNTEPCPPSSSSTTTRISAKLCRISLRGKVTQSCRLLMAQMRSTYSQQQSRTRLCAIGVCRRWGALMCSGQCNRPATRSESLSSFSRLMATPKAPCRRCRQARTTSWLSPLMWMSFCPLSTGRWSTFSSSAV